MDELQRELRRGGTIKLDSKLQAGGAGEIILKSENKCAARRVGGPPDSQPHREAAPTAHGQGGEDLLCLPRREGHFVRQVAKGAGLAGWTGFVTGEERWRAMASTDLAPWSQDHPS